MNPPEATVTAALVDEWAEWMTARGYHQVSVTTRRRILADVAAWAVETGIPAEITTAVMADYTAHLTATERPATVRFRLLTLRAFATWSAATHPSVDPQEAS